jgi:hypothetical protein
MQVTIVMYLVPVLVMTLSYSMILVKLFCRTQPGTLYTVLTIRSVIRSNFQPLLRSRIIIFMLHVPGPSSG